MEEFREMTQSERVNKVQIEIYLKIVMHLQQNLKIKINTCTFTCSITLKIKGICTCSSCWP